MSTAADTDLRAALERALGVPVVRLTRAASEYATSHALEELTLELDGGEVLELVFKDLSAPSAAAMATKPAFLRDPAREIEVYTRLLPSAGLGTATCAGAVSDDATGRHWLFIERVRGVELYQVGSRASWAAVAAWLARMHTRLAPAAKRSGRLLRYDDELLRTWPGRAAEFAGGPERDRLAQVAARYDTVLARLASIPDAVVHGELYASNVLIDDPDQPTRVCPVDWEMAGVGPRLLDLAALVSGRWARGDRDVIAEAYRDAMPPHVRTPSRDFHKALDACRLTLALQWLGWSPSWTPPEDHRTDWIVDALELAETLGI